MTVAPSYEVTVPPLSGLAVPLVTGQIVFRRILTGVEPEYPDARVGAVAGGAARQAPRQTGVVPGPIQGIAQRLPPNLDAAVGIHHCDPLDGGLDQHERIVGMGVEWS